MIPFNLNVMTDRIKKLPIEFIGRGEVKGFHFHQLLRGQLCCLYEVASDQTPLYFEVFKIRVFKVPKRNELYEPYPKANSFGIWAWTYSSYNKAIINFKNLNNNEKTL